MNMTYFTLYWMKPQSSPYMVVERLESPTSIRNNHIQLQCLLGASILFLACNLFATSCAMSHSST